MPDFAQVTNVLLLIVVIILIRPHLHRWRKRLNIRRT